MFDREELTALRERASEESRIVSLIPDWADAYRELARAADRLDAMTARCTVREND